MPKYDFSNLVNPDPNQVEDKHQNVSIYPFLLYFIIFE